MRYPLAAAFGTLLLSARLLLAQDVPAQPADAGAKPLPEEIGKPADAGAKPLPDGIAQPADAGAKPLPEGTAKPADPCDGPCCDLKQPCGPPGRAWVMAEYLLWWIKNDHAPPLVTTGPASFPVAFLGNPGTAVLNNGTINRGTLSGARLWAGYWLNECQTFGIMANIFGLGLGSQNSTLNSNTFPVLARPFINQNTGGEFSEFTAFPGISTGQIRISSPSQLWGGLIGFRKNCCCGCWYRLDALGGFNYLNLSESLTIQEAGTFSPTSPQLPGTSFLVNDKFATQNRFYGSYLGLFGEARRNKWFVDLRGLVGLGVTHQTVDISGNQILSSPTGVSTFPGGLLAERSNIGHFTRDRFGVVPEIDLLFGRQITSHLRVYAGYSLIFWNNVARPGGQIDRVIDVTQIPNFGATNPPTANPRPGVLFNSTDFWAQGITFGVGFSW